MCLLSRLPHLKSLIKYCLNKTQLLQIHSQLITSSLFEDPSISFAFLSRATILLPLKSSNYSLFVFKHIAKPNIYHHNSLLNAYSQSNNPEKAFFLYKCMINCGLLPNAFSSSFVLKSCIRASSLFFRQVHTRIFQDGHHMDSVLLTTLMELYAMGSDGNDARKVFDEMPKKDVVSWNVLISCYANNKRSKDALRLFDVMQKSSFGSEPDDVTCLILLQVCANLNALSFGERIHEYIDNKRHGNSLKLNNSLISMYSRCGAIERAYDVFCDTEEKNVVTWSAMISGLAMNGCEREALDAFEEMRRLNITPDEQTFTSVLSACSHCGLIEEGRDLFNMMKNEYRIIPNVHHYGCIVNLLSRIGSLNRAYKLIVNEMKVEPDATIWRTLLGACRIHGHIELGERVINHLIELKAEQTGDYILLLNMYASNENWEKVSYVRRLMKDNGIQTTPGCTTIELKGVIQEFLVDDSLHPRKVEIYEMLDDILEQLKIAGYVADMSSELHFMEGKEKVSALSYHSEKLAIAFGILATPPGTSIRIANNLRICIDCHNFGKAVSSVYNRLIIVRDRNRFHHFREGRCSCNDYW